MPDNDKVFNGEEFRENGRREINPEHPAFGMSEAQSASYNAGALQDACTAAGEFGGRVVLPARTYELDTSALADGILIPEGIEFEGIQSRSEPANEVSIGTRFNWTGGDLLFHMNGGWAQTRMRGFQIGEGPGGGTAIRVARFDTSLELITFLWCDAEIMIDLDENSGGAPSGGCYTSELDRIRLHNWDGTTAYGDIGIRLKNAVNALLLKHCLVNGANIAGIDMQGGSAVTMFKGTVERCSAIGAVGVRIGEGANPLNAVHLIGTYFEQNRTDVKMTRGKSIALDDLYCFQNVGDYSVDIADASGDGSNLPSVRILGGRYEGPAVVQNIRCVGTTNVVAYNPHLSHGVEVGAGGKVSFVTGSFLEIHGNVRGDSLQSFNGPLTMGATDVITAARVLQNITGNIEQFNAGKLAVVRGGAGTTSPRENLLAYAASGTAAPDSATTGIQLGINVTLAAAGLKVGDTIGVFALARGGAADTQTRVKLRFRDGAAATISDHNGNTIVGLTEAVSKNEGIVIPANTVDILVGTERVGGSGAATTRQHVLKLMTL